MKRENLLRSIHNIISKCNKNIYIYIYTDLSVNFTHTCIHVILSFAYFSLKGAVIKFDIDLSKKNEVEGGGGHAVH